MGALLRRVSASSNVCCWLPTLLALHDDHSRRHVARFERERMARVIVIPSHFPERTSPMGTALALYTLLHVVLSLIGIFSGLLTVGGFVAGKRLDGWANLFLVTTLATNVGGSAFLSRSSCPPMLWRSSRSWCSPS